MGGERATVPPRLLQRVDGCAPLVANLRQDLPNAPAMKVIIGGIASGGDNSDFICAQQSA
jgi:hypothetical protein